jgi:hypothetical protein
LAVCLNCNCVFSEPGTCNCYAPGGLRQPRTYTTTDLQLYCQVCFKPRNVPKDSSVAPCDCHGQRVTVS